MEPCDSIGSPLSPQLLPMFQLEEEQEWMEGDWMLDATPLSAISPAADPDPPLFSSPCTTDPPLFSSSLISLDTFSSSLFKPEHTRLDTLFHSPLLLDSHIKIPSDQQNCFPFPISFHLEHWIHSIHLLACELVLLSKALLDPKNPEVVHAVYQLCHLSPMVRQEFEAHKIRDIPLFKRRGRKPRHILDLEETWDLHSKTLMDHHVLPLSMDYMQSMQDETPSECSDTTAAHSRASSVSVECKPTFRQKTKSFSSEFKASFVRRLSFTKEKPPNSPTDTTMEPSKPEQVKHRIPVDPPSDSIRPTTKPPLPSETTQNTTKQRWMQKRSEASWQYMSSFTIKKSTSKSKQRG